MLTIFTPVYNAEPFLDRLFASFDELPAERVELLFVEDGSTDKSLAMLREYCDAREHARLLINESNSGIGVSSNRALDEARGEFVMRCDADDEIIAAGVMAGLDRAERGDVDMVPCANYEHAVGEQPRLRIPAGKPEDGNWLKRFWEFRDWNSNLWCTVIRKGYFEERGVRFSEVRDLMGEDTLIIADLLAGIGPERIAISEAPAYHYHRRIGSTSRPKKQKREHYRRYAHKLLMQQVEMESQVMRFIEKGFIERDFAHAMLAERAAAILRRLKQAGDYHRVVVEYHRVRARYGPNKRNRGYFLKCLPLGVWRCLWP